MGRKNIEFKEIKKEYDIVEEVLSKYNPVLSARDLRIEGLSDNAESKGFNYTEEDDSYNKLGL
jgi:hypothetical protein